MVDGLIKVTSEYGFAETFQRAQNAIKSRGMELFSIIDHRKNAEDAGLELGECKLLIFGSANAGTKLMQDKISIAIDLPLRLLISEEEGKVVLRYYNPLHLAKVHKLDSNLDTINKVSGALNAIVMEAAKR